MSLRIGIALGDVTGIGPEVTLKALASAARREDARYLLIGDAGWLERLNSGLGLHLPLDRFGGWHAPGRFLIWNPLSQPLPEKLVAGDPTAARAAVAWLETAAQICLRGELDALVTAPVNKASIVGAGISFVGQTEFLSQLAGARRTAMMLLGPDAHGRWLRVALVTTHLPLRAVPDSITPDKVQQTIELAAEACQQLGLGRARVAVCGLNPHAGEGGTMGHEEQQVIEPAIQAARARGLEVAGPLSGDAVFHAALRGEFDAVVAMYHDQGLAPLKAVAFDSGVNWTLGLPFIRTSPDHGTAYDIAGRGVANASSMSAALQLARELALRRRAGA
ncbi:MAG: 4-hydroxythreonine-4-phosphate dehydrogenase PdxA [Verrucomicrobiales bacterium]|nr:4-hydroxythreonine-4-phosphate dehydrogenase PdxA [Verrucomicrobiales bacterium]